jgi:hypothetical protein
MTPCECGCGKLAAKRFLRGHNNFLRAAAPLTDRYVERDCGFRTPCWVWTGCRIYSGYGRLSVAGKLVLAHRYAYELLRQPIPAGLTLDHLCRNRACINPEHLEPVSVAENTRRGGMARRRASFDELMAMREAGLLLREIGERVGLSEGRVCTILKAGPDA